MLQAQVKLQGETAWRVLTKTDQTWFTPTRESLEEIIKGHKQTFPENKYRIIDLSQ